MNNALDIISLKTELNDEKFKDIDTLSAIEIVKIINNEDKVVAYAVEKVLPHIAEAATEIAKRFEVGGRIIYTGAGSSGRIGVFDAVELKPTYNVPNDRVFGIIAGGSDAMFIAQEGAEDSIELAKSDMDKVQLTEKDVVIGIAASGRTPYTIAALEYAKEKNAYTVAITNNSGGRLAKVADCPIVIEVGPEVIAGSTRMKAGTSQKMVTNMLSTTVMILTGKVYENYMVHVQSTNEKLVARSINIIHEITGISHKKAEILFNQAKNSVAHAIVMNYTNVDYDKADTALIKSQGRVRQAIKELGVK